MRLEGFSDISEVLRSGVYVLGWKGTVVYVGQSKSMYARIYAHRNLWNNARRGKAEPTWLPSSVKGMLFDEVYIRPCPLEGLNELERRLIELYKPKYNIVHKTKTRTASPLTLRIGGIPITMNAHVPPRMERRC